jgi:hypothetical protein
MAPTACTVIIFNTVSTRLCVLLLCLSEDPHVCGLPYPRRVVIVHNKKQLCCVFEVLFCVYLNKTLQRKCMIQNICYVICSLFVNNHKPLKVIFLVGVLKVKGKIFSMYN